MPTGAAIDLVAKDLGVECFETPTGEKSVPQPLNRVFLSNGVVQPQTLIMRPGRHRCKARVGNATCRFAMANGRADSLRLSNWLLGLT